MPPTGEKSQKKASQTVQKAAKGYHLFMKQMVLQHQSHSQAVLRHQNGRVSIAAVNFRLFPFLHRPTKISLAFSAAFVYSIGANASGFSEVWYHACFGGASRALPVADSARRASGCGQNLASECEQQILGTATGRTKQTTVQCRPLHLYTDFRV